jgi:hypothetical protein
MKGEFLESLAALARAVFKCIENKQTNILLYVLEDAQGIDVSR